jgi:hypothetical protein
MMKKLVWVLVVIIVFLGIGVVVTGMKLKGLCQTGPQRNIIGWMTYINEDKSFGFEYKPDWSVSVGDNNKNWKVLGIGSKVNTGKQRMVMGFLFYKKSGTDGDTLAGIALQLAKTGTLEKIKVGCDNGYEMILKDSAASDTRKIVLVFEHGGVIYQWLMGSVGVQGPSDITELENMIYSMRFR